MSKEFGSQTIEGLSNTAAQQQQQQQVQIQVDDAQAHTAYSSLALVNATAEEILVNFSGPLRPTGPKSALMKVDLKVIMSPWAAKRLAISLGQTMQRYEETYGNIEIDEHKRRVAQPTPQPTGKPN